MALRPPFTRSRGQPKLNLRHPLSRGMTDCLVWNGLIPQNLALPTVKTTLTGAPTLVPTTRGYAGYSTGGTGFNIPDHGNYAAADFAIRVLVRIVSWPGAYTTLFDKGISGNRELALFFDTSGNVNYASVGLTPAALSIATAMVAGGTYDLVMTRIGANLNFYINGVSVGTSAAFTSTTASVNPLNFGVNVSGGGVNADAQYITAQLWTRGLSAGEAMRLYREPFLVLDYQDIRRTGIFTPGAYILTAAAGTFNLTGQAAILRTSRNLVAVKGTFALSGVAAGLRIARKLVANAGSFALTGQAANLVYTPAHAAYVLTAGVGSFALTGKAATLRAGRKLVSGTGSFALTGIAAGLIYTVHINYALPCGAGSFALVGYDATFRRMGGVFVPATGRAVLVPFERRVVTARYDHR